MGSTTTGLLWVWGVGSGLLLGGAPFISGCESTVPAEPLEAPSQVHLAATTPAPDGCDALQELARLDSRKAVPLQPMMAWHQKQNMMEHLVAIERITAALAADDWDGVARAAAALESSQQMQQMCRHLGAGADGFTELALDFHRRADAIAPAARASNTKQVLRATANTLAACSACHATFRQHVVSAAEWSEAVGQSADPNSEALQPHGH